MTKLRFEMKAYVIKHEGLFWNGETFDVLSRALLHETPSEAVKFWEATKSYGLNVEPEFVSVEVTE